jgi:hypothetical protein
MGRLAESLKPVAAAALQIVPSRDGSKITLRLSGNADTEAQPGLTAFLESLHETAVGSGVTLVVVNLDELYFMTSACFKCLVTWLIEIEKMELALRYRVHFEPNPNLHWQNRSLEALRTLSRGVVHIRS